MEGHKVVLVDSFGKCIGQTHITDNYSTGKARTFFYIGDICGHNGDRVQAHLQNVLDKLAEAGYEPKDTGKVNTRGRWIGQAQIPQVGDYVQVTNPTGMPCHWGTLQNICKTSVTFKNDHGQVLTYARGERWADADQVIKCSDFESYDAMCMFALHIQGFLDLAKLHPDCYWYSDLTIINKELMGVKGVEMENLGKSRHDEDPSKDEDPSEDEDPSKDEDPSEDGDSSRGEDPSEDEDPSKDEDPSRDEDSFEDEESFEEKNDDVDYVGGDTYETDGPLCFVPDGLFGFKKGNGIVISAFVNGSIVDIDTPELALQLFKECDKTGSTLKAFAWLQVALQLYEPKVDYRH